MPRFDLSMTSLRIVFRMAALALCSAAIAGCAGGTGATPPIPTSAAQTSRALAPMLVVSRGANSAITLTGTVEAVYSGWFEIQGGYGVGNLHVYTPGATAYTGKKPYAGEVVEVTGAGSVSTSVTATSVQQLLSV